LEKYQEVAESVRQLIADGTYPPGSEVPSIEAMMGEYGVSRTTVRSAIKLLADDGLLNPGRGRRKTTVRDSRRIKVSFSRYDSVMQPGGSAGPWETACAEQGLDGQMKTVAVDTRPIGQADADLLGVEPGSDVTYRLRHACVGDEVLQVQQAWYPAGVALQAGLSSPAKVRGGVYGALTAAGLPPAAVDETIRGRMPTKEEADLMRTGTGVPLLTVERVTRGADGQALELLRVTAPADRIEFVYTNLPLAGGRTT
jgi:DNA-binding GntR family transcriptional regulator